MDTTLLISRKWWTFLVRGLAAFAVGTMALLAPGILAPTLVLVLASYFIIGGIMTSAAALGGGAKPWWPFVLLGMFQIAGGLLMFADPGIGSLTLVLLFATLTIASGLMEIHSALMLHETAVGSVWWFALGTITLIIGVYCALHPALGLSALVFTVAVYAFTTGITLCGVAFRLRRLRHGRAPLAA